MLTLRKASDRGHADHGWLDSHHSFSFADYYDPAHMGFGALRVINEDRVQPGKGFGTHGHRDMEILSYVLEGELEHKDNMGNGSIIVPGDVQRMSAGRGVLHSEYNPSRSNPVHFLQIWIEPAQRGIDPGYEQTRFEPAQKRGRLRLIASPDGRGGLGHHSPERVGLRRARRRRRDRAPRPRAGSPCLCPCRARQRARERNRACGRGCGRRSPDEAAVTLDGGRDAEVLLFDLD